MYANFLLSESPRESDKPPKIVLLHGPPGVGKSKVRDANVKAVTACGRYNLLTAFNAINATEMGGVTVSYLTNLNSEIHAHHVGTFKDSTLQNLRNQGYNEHSFNDIEECSNLAPWHLSRLSLLGCSANNILDKRFGDTYTRLSGDLTQLGPVKAGATLAQGVMDIYADSKVRKWMTNRESNKETEKTVLPFVQKEDEKRRANHPFRIGVDIMTELRWFEFTQQQRAITDPNHTRLVNKTYRGEPLTMREIKDNYKILSPSDCTKDEWVKASIIVCTNRERCSLTHTRAIQYATHFGTIVLRWLKDFKCWKQRPPPEYEASALQDPCFYEYYVEGVEGYLNENIMRDLCLVNAVPIVYHSVKFDEETEKWMRPLIDSSPSGTVITSPTRPICINVKLLMPDNTPSIVMKALRSFSIVPMPKDDPKADIVVPIGEFFCKWDRSLTPVHGSYNFAPSRVLLRQYFPVETGFAATVHKSEGRTMPESLLPYHINKPTDAITLMLKYTWHFQECPRLAT